MLTSEDLSAIIERIASHQHTDEDLLALSQAISADSSQNRVQIGRYNVNITQGQGIHIGDTIYQGSDAEAIREVIEQLRINNNYCDVLNQELKALSPFEKIINYVRVIFLFSGVLILWVFAGWFADFSFPYKFIILLIAHCFGGNISKSFQGKSEFIYRNKQESNLQKANRRDSEYWLYIQILKIFGKNNSENKQRVAELIGTLETQRSLFLEELNNLTKTNKKYRFLILLRKKLQDILQSSLENEYSLIINIIDGLVEAAKRTIYVNDLADKLDRDIKNYSPNISYDGIRILDKIKLLLLEIVRANPDYNRPNNDGTNVPPIDNLREENQQLRTQLNNLRIEANFNENVLNRQNRQLQYNLKNQIENNNNLIHKNQTLINEKNELDIRYQTLIQKKKNIESKINKLENKIKSLEEERSKLGNQNDNRMTSINKLIHKNKSKNQQDNLEDLTSDIPVSNSPPNSSHNQQESQIYELESFLESDLQNQNGQQIQSQGYH